MSALAIDFTQPFEDAFGKLLGFIPNLLGGLVILVIGYFVAKVLGKLVGKLLGKVGFDRWMERAGVSGILERSGTGLTASAMLGKVVFWFVFLISFTMFASALGVPEISAFMSSMLSYIPRIFAAIVILCLAALFANFLAAIIRGATGNETLAKVGRYAILVYAAFAALTQLGIAVQLTGNTLLIVLGGMALALGLAFGLGGREMAGDALRKLFERGANPSSDGTTTQTTTGQSQTGYDGTQSGYGSGTAQGGYDPNAAPQQSGYGDQATPQSGYGEQGTPQYPATHGAPQSGRNWTGGADNGWSDPQAGPRHS